MSAIRPQSRFDASVVVTFQRLASEATLDLIRLARGGMVRAFTRKTGKGPMTKEEKRVAFAATLFARFTAEDAYRFDDYEHRYIREKTECAWKLADKMIEAEPSGPG